jgi:hypothetical protein
VDSVDWRGIIGTDLFVDYVVRSVKVSGTVAGVSCAPESYVAGGFTACRVGAGGTVQPLHSATDAGNGWRGVCPAGGANVSTEVWAVCAMPRKLLNR